MMRINLFAAFIILILNMSGWAAGFKSESPRLRFFTQADYWLEGDVWEEAQGYYNQINSVNVDVDKGGPALRVGAFLPLPNKNLKMGLSFGYIQGPGLSVTAPSLLPGSFIKGDLRFTRLLAEGLYEIPLGSNLSFRLHGGLGEAWGRIDSDIYLIYGGNVFYRSKDYVTMQGFSWEVGPSIAIVGERIDVELGLAYTEFPKYEKYGSKIEWHPYGARLAIMF